MKDLSILHRTKLSTRVPWILAFAVLLLAGIAGMAWALPGKAALGQTIPPPPTRTPTPAGSLQPTPTWTPRPTWTRAPTLPSPQATTTPQSPIVPPTPTRTAVAALSPTPSMPVVSTPTASPKAPEATPLPTATPPVVPLVFEIATHPQVAGPTDEVYFILRVANVGYDPIEGVAVSISWPEALVGQSVDCGRCTIAQEAARWHLSIGRLLPGEQVLSPILAQVAEDAWPGQLLQTEWTLTAEGMPSQSAQAAIELPWAELPATGATE